MSKVKSITLHVSEEFHKKVKLHTSREDIKIKDYIISLVRKDLENKQNKSK